MTSTVTCVAYIISPIHVVSAICGILARHPDKNVRVVVLVHWPGAEDNLIDELTGLARKMLSSFPFVEKVIPVPSSVLSQWLMVKKFSELESLIKSRICVKTTDEIYYSHDVVGCLYQVLSTVYVGAERICFGDAMGQVVERKIHLGYLGIFETTLQKSYRLLGIIKSRLNRTLAKIVPVHRAVFVGNFSPNAAALILPVDQTGKALQQIKVSVCPKDVVIEVLNASRESCSDLARYISEVLAMFSGRQKYLLLTENGAEGNFIDFDREIEMYCSIIREKCVSGSVVFLKSHPAETLPRNERIVKMLDGEFEVIALDSRYKRYPIELWQELILESTVICMSYPVLSLKYLYDINAIQPMDNTFVERWFPEWAWASYKNAFALYMEPIKNLPGWDGKTILWKPTN